MGIEKRTAKRFPFTVNVTYRVNDQERSASYHVQSMNISEGGIFLKTDIPLGIGTEVELEFFLPGEDKKLYIQGQVTWSEGKRGQGEDSPPGKGIAFTESDEQGRERLKKFISREITD